MKMVVKHGIKLSLENHFGKSLDQVPINNIRVAVYDAAAKYDSGILSNIQNLYKCIISGNAEPWKKHFAQLELDAIEDRTDQVLKHGKIIK